MFDFGSQCSRIRRISRERRTSRADDLADGTGQLAETLRTAVAFAAYEFIIGLLLDNPQRVGKRLEPPLDDRYSARRGTYRVIYRVDEAQHIVTVVAVVRRADAYRS